MIDRRYLLKLTYQSLLVTVSNSAFILSSLCCTLLSLLWVTDTVGGLCWQCLLLFVVVVGRCHKLSAVTVVALLLLSLVFVTNHCWLL